MELIEGTKMRMGGGEPIDLTQPMGPDGYIVIANRRPHLPLQTLEEYADTFAAELLTASAVRRGMTDEDVQVMRERILKSERTSFGDPVWTRDHLLNWHGWSEEDLVREIARPNPSKERHEDEHEAFEAGTGELHVAHTHWVHRAMPAVLAQADGIPRDVRLMLLHLWTTLVEGAVLDTSPTEYDLFD